MKQIFAQIKRFNWLNKMIWNTPFVSVNSRCGSGTEMQLSNIFILHLLNLIYCWICYSCELKDSLCQTANSERVSVLMFCLKWALMLFLKYIQSWCVLSFLLTVPSEYNAVGCWFFFPLSIFPSPLKIFTIICHTPTAVVWCHCTKWRSWVVW